MGKIAVIADIHSNITALEAVIDDIKRRNINRIFCLGDIVAKGVHADECINIIRDRCEVVLAGNCDIAYSNDKPYNSADKKAIEIYNWNRSLISNDNIRYLKTLPSVHEMYISGSYIRFFHSTPSSPFKTLTTLDSINDKIKLFEPHDGITSNITADIVIQAHVHVQALDRFCNKTLINVGSVGNSLEIIQEFNIENKNMETTQGFYLILDGDIGSTEYKNTLSYEFIRVPYDIKKELNNDIYNIEKKEYIKELENGIYRNMEKINNYHKKIGIK